MFRHLAIAAFCAVTLPVRADPAEVLDANVFPDGDRWRVDVTIRHGDTGWDDYADGWRVETSDGQVLGTRVLHHPHVEEQPFTRSLGGVEIPPELGHVYIRTRTSVTGWADEVSAPVAVPGAG
jgi:hypothetical protein